MTKTDKTASALACCCIGPQNGEPLCPCRMRNEGIFERNGAWVRPERVIGAVAPKIKTAPLGTELQEKNDENDN